VDQWNLANFSAGSLEEVLCPLNAKLVC